MEPALNDVFGGALEASANPLAIQMSLHTHGRPVALTPASLASLRDRVLGDGLVQPSSASTSELEGDVERCAMPGLGHMALLSHPRVYALLRRWLGAPDASPSAPS